MRVLAVVLGLAALAATPCLALTIQAAPPRPDIAQHLRSQAPAASGVLPGPGDLRGSFVAPERPGFSASGPTSATTGAVGFGPLRATTTVTPGYSPLWSGGSTSSRDSGNPLSLTLPRR